MEPPRVAGLSAGWKCLAVIGLRTLGPCHRMKCRPSASAVDRACAARPEGPDQTRTTLKLQPFASHLRYHYMTDFQPRLLWRTPIGFRTFPASLSCATRLTRAVFRGPRPGRSTTGKHHRPMSTRPMPRSRGPDHADPSLEAIIAPRAGSNQGLFNNFGADLGIYGFYLARPRPAGDDPSARSRPPRLTRLSVLRSMS